MNVLDLRCSLSLFKADVAFSWTGGAPPYNTGIWAGTSSLFRSSVLSVCLILHSTFQDLMAQL
jgi:hypothetical protein